METDKSSETCGSAVRSTCAEQGTSAREHAFNFLLPIDPRHAVRAIAKRLWDAASDDDVIAGKFVALQNKLGSGKPLIHAKHYDIYNRLKDSSTSLDIPTSPEWIRPAIAAAYLRAKSALATGGSFGLFDSLTAKFDRVLQLAERIEESFIGELLVETVLAAKGDPGFARKLREGASEFRALVEELYGPDGKERPAAVARRINAAGGDGDCLCCDGNGNCAPCSCWIIVVIIIVIIVTK